MAMVELKDLYKVTAKGHVYYYAWRGKGAPRIKAPYGTPEFAAEYAAHHAARKGGDKALISGLIVDFKQSDAWTKPPEQGGLAASTKREWSRGLDEIQAQFGSLPTAGFENEIESRREIKRWRDKWKDKPRTADKMKQTLSVLLTFAVEQERLKHNPCIGLKNLYSSDRADIIWTDDDIAAFAAARDKWGRLNSREIVWALKLATLTGLRQADLLRLSWSHVGDLAIELGTNKSRVRGSRQRTATIPMYGELKALLAEIPKRATTVLTNTDGLPWRDGFRGSWNDALGRAGLKGKLRFHDARGTFATCAFLAGFKIREIAQMLAWSEDKVEKIIDRYVRRDAILRERIRQMDEARTIAEKPVAKPAQVSRQDRKQIKQ